MRVQERRPRLSLILEKGMQNKKFKNRTENLFRKKKKKKRKDEGKNINTIRRDEWQPYLGQQVG